MNNDWMNPAADAIDLAGHQNPTALGNEKTLRLMDLSLAGLVSALLIALLPLILWAWLSGKPQSNRRLGAGRRPFTLRSWRFADSANGRLLRRLGARSWPALIHILRGEMAWVGPRPRRVEEPTGPATHLRPGLTGLHQLRRATAVDFATEDASEAAYLAQRSVSNDLRLLVLSSWHSVGRRSMASKAKAPARVKILDTTVDNLSMEGTLQRVMSLVESGTHAKVGFVNPACANIAAGSHAYRRDLAALDLVLPDGIGMKIAADWLGTPIRQNVNGTDFFPRLCNAMNERSQRLYLVGARPEVVARVAEVVGDRWPKIELVGAQHGYFNSAEEVSVAHDIQESGAHVVLVAMGVPAQENFIARLGDRMGPCVALGVGGLFDFVAGRVSRAPQWMRDAGLEWTWRLIQEPGRMWQRYLLGYFSFLARVAMQRAGWRKGQTTKAQTNPMPTTQSKQSAVLLATHLVEIGTETRLAACLPFGPSSFAETVVAQLASHSVAHIHVLLAPDAAPHKALQQQLGDGRRWGVQIHWHQSAQKEAPFQPLRAMADGQTKPLLLINAHTWLNTEGLARVMREPQMVVHTNGDGQVAWQGWACVTPGELNALSRCSDAESLEAALTECIPTRYIAMPKECANAHSQAAWLAAQTAVPPKALVALQTDVWTAHPWGYASAQAHISPDAHIEGPVWIGPGCVVRADAHLGPQVTLTRNVVVDKHAVLANAVALPDVFVGTQAKVTDGVFMAELHTENDPFEPALPPTEAMASAAPAGHLSRLLGFVLAALLAPVAWPLMGTRKLLGRPAAWASERVVRGRSHLGARLLTVTLRQPKTARNRVEHLLAWYGAVLDLAQGHRQWVGIRARRVEQWFSLDADTREALNFAPIGLWHPVAWTNRLDCVLDSEAVADRMWRASQRRTTAASRAGSGKPRLRWTTGLMSYRALTAT